MNVHGGLFNSYKLIEDAIFIVKRDSKNAIIPLRTHFQKDRSTIILRSGQIVGQKLSGLGRKITLKPYIENNEKLEKFISGFNQFLTFIEEGEFCNDMLHNTFGRKVCSKTLNSIGWYKQTGSQLHGYAKQAADGNI